MRPGAAGFMTVELLLVIAFFALMAGVVSLPLSNLQTDAAGKDAAIIVTDELRRAVAQAMSGHDGDQWGIHFSDADGCALPATKIHVFRGAAFTSATDTIDTIDLPAGAAVTGLAIGGGCDARFSRFHGATASAGTVTLTDARGQVLTVTINAYGRISSP